MLLVTWVALLPAVLASAAEADASREHPRMATYRVEVDGFEASEADMRAVLDSAGGALWRFFPDYRLEPLVVTRGHSGPITLYRRNDRGEIVIRLDTGKTYWCQYAYQFAHEFCHVLSGFREGNQVGRWFEESLCETASLFAMRSMARSWKDNPPYPNSRDYRDSLRDYTDDVMRKRERVFDLVAQGLPTFYRANQEALAKETMPRELNGAMSVVWLQLFEERPERWESIRWLNATPAQEGDSFQVYLQKWHDAAPAQHQPFVRRIGELFGMPVGGP